MKKKDIQSYKKEESGKTEEVRDKFVGFKRKKEKLRSRGKNMRKVQRKIEALMGRRNYEKEEKFLLL